MKIAKKLLLLVLVVSLAFGLRAYAAARLDVDYDEPVYLDNALEYANYFRQGRYSIVSWSENTYEHPALYKMVYGAALLSQPPLEKLYEKDLFRQTPIDGAPAKEWNMVGRYISVVLGTLTVLALSLLNPAAGLILGISSLSIKYTSEFYLEALPFLTSLLCALSYLKWYRMFEAGAGSTRRAAAWMALSALCLGLTAAGKYVYCIVGLAVLLHFCAEAISKKVFLRSLPIILGWGALALVCFLLFNPYLWPDPIERLSKTLEFHMQYKESAHVRSYNYPFWQPLIWLSTFTTHYDYHPRSALLLNLDLPIFLLACLGLPRLFKRQRFFFYWLLVGMLMLLIWTTKWPQYTMIVMAPFSLAAAAGLATLWNLAALVRNATAKAQSR